MHNNACRKSTLYPADPRSSSVFLHFLAASSDTDQERALKSKTSDQSSSASQSFLKSFQSRRLIFNLKSPFLLFRSKCGFIDFQRVSLDLILLKFFSFWFLSLYQRLEQELLEVRIFYCYNSDIEQSCLSLLDAISAIRLRSCKVQSTLRAGQSLGF